LEVGNIAESSKEQREQGELHNGTRAAHRDERQRALVIAAYQLIAEKGFEHLRTRDVAARAQVNIATLHYYFAGKEDLIRGVVDHLLHEFSTIPAGYATADPTPLGQVRRMFLMTDYRFQMMPEMFMVLSELVLRSVRDASIRSAVQHLDEGWHAYLQRVVHDGVRQGVFRTNIDAANMASRLIILMKGFFYHQITSPESVTIDQLLDDIERLLLP
jgi:AcrR family transcriptional regulator